MTATDFDLTRSNATVYPDEVALVNVFRRTKRGLRTGYGDIHFTVEVVDHCGTVIKTVIEERAIVDQDAPTMVGVIYDLTGKATRTGDEMNRSKLAWGNSAASSETVASGPRTSS